MKKLSFENVVFLIVLGIMFIFLAITVGAVIKDTDNMEESRNLKEKIQPYMNEYNSNMENIQFSRLEVYKEDKTFQVVQWIYAPSYVIDTYYTLMHSEDDEEAMKNWEVYIGDLKQYSEDAKEYINTDKHYIMSAKYVNINTMEELLWVDEYGVIRYDIINVEDLGGIDYLD